MSGPLALLGHQRPRPRVAEALAHYGCRGRVAVISAGWRHDEPELDALERDLGRRLVHLPLYRWFDEITLGNTALGTAYSERQKRIIAYKSAYREQISHAMEAVAAMQLRVARNPDLYDPELQFTHRVLRAIDSRALVRVEEIRCEFPATATPWDVPAVRRRHDEIASVLSDVDAVLIAGGHVGVLRNRLFFFGLDMLLPQALEAGTAVVAWSAGAMALTDRIVLFYDDPPEGKGHAEMFDLGLGLVSGIRPFPHAQQRLRVHDPARMARLVQRLNPAPVVAMEAGAWLEHTDDDGWVDRSDPESCWTWDRDGLPCGLPTPLSFDAPRTQVGQRTVTP